MAEEDLLRLISELQSNCHHQWKKIMICERGKKIVKHYECLNCRKVKPAKWQLGTNVCKRCDGELELIGFDFLRPRDRAVYRCKDCGWQ